MKMPTKVKRKWWVFVMLPMAFLLIAPSCYFQDNYHMAHISGEHIDTRCGDSTPECCPGGKYDHDCGNILDGWPYDIVWAKEVWYRYEFTYDSSCACVHYHWVLDGPTEYLATYWARHNCYWMKYISGYWAGDPPYGPCYTVNGYAVPGDRGTPYNNYGT